MTIAAVRAKFWTCNVTGLKVHDSAVPPLMANAVTGVVFLLVGGLLSVLIGLTRWEAIDLLPDNWYYVVLTLHAWSMLIFWIIFIEVAILYFACTAVLNARLVSPKAAWLAYAMMLGGAALAALTALLQGDTRDQPLLTSYVPLDIHPLFFVGAIIFAVGALLATGIFFATIFMAKRERTYEGSLPLVTFGAAIAAIIAVESLLGGAIAYIWQLLWAIGLVDSIDAEMYRVVWWLLGHGTQQINLVAMVSVWYLLAHLSTGAQSASEKVSRTGFVLYLLFINLGAAHHHLSDPGVTSAWRIWNAGYAMYGAAMASLIHAFAIPASIELALRKQGHGGLFGWLRHAPWGNPAFAALAVSLPLFGILGGITGITFGTEQLNMMVHNTLAITGHFHGTVVAGTTIAFMGVAYAVIWLIGLRELLSERLATLQIYVFGAGMAVFVVAMMWMGYFFGIPRRHPDVSSLPIIRSPSLETIVGVAGVVAILGGVLFLALAVGTLLLGTRREKGPVVVAVGGPSIGGQTPVPTEHTSEHGKAHDLRGTLTLSFVFLAVFIVIYATHWINLSSLWSIG
ncbi:MAG: cbb3-type cytochrome c oxidase subunit I [SAR202 cluster bacterium]|jgi:cytochrome c oxidase subunit 1|nr:cbb3-type cytochrome c oxidase subunit I [SAR202 cluster bacterium]